jgi:hypothetical protein
MWYFDELTEASFKTDEKGNTIYYPLWIFGKGYILPEDKKDAFRLMVKRLVLLCVPLAVIFSIFLSIVQFFFIVLPLYFLGCTIWMKKNISGLSISSGRLTISDIAKGSSQSNNVAILWVLEIFSFLFIIASIFVLGHIIVGFVIN